MNSQFFDSHFHLSSETDFEDYKREAESACVRFLMAVGSNYETSMQSKKFAETSSDIFFSVGAHPHEAEKFLNRLGEFIPLASGDSCRAVGEIGLDYFHANSQVSKQIKMFEKFLDLSLEIGLPAIVHCRDANESFRAYDDAEALLKPFSAAGGRFVVHCFTGTIEWAERFLNLGAYIGITGIATFPKAENVRKVAAMVPEDRLLIETDSPYLAPVPFRGKTNHSKHIPLVAAAVAEARGVDVAEIAESTTSNALRLFQRLRKGSI